MKNVVATYSSVLADDPEAVLQREFDTVQEAWLAMPSDLKFEFEHNRANCTFFYDDKLYVFSWLCHNPTMLYIVHGMANEMEKHKCS